MQVPIIGAGNRDGLSHGRYCPIFAGGKAAPDPARAVLPRRSQALLSGIWRKNPQK
ncbi:dihydroorotase, homodimeric type [Comamonas thiooxydans]|nr:dihydroorotase, homodimeric type [Comamonas thiooxydans]